MYEPYDIAIKMGDKLAKYYGTQDATYWAVRQAARQAAGALLDTARRVEVTPEQWEELRKVACEVAPD